MTGAKIETNPSDFDDYPALMSLLQAAFAYMEPRIDPPSSLMQISLADLTAKARTEDLFLLRLKRMPIGCLFGTARADSYYIGKLAVAAPQRGQGHARALVEAAAREAHRRGRAALVLQSRVELVENHAAFVAMGFHQTDATAHPGFTRPTSLTFTRALT